MAFTRHLFREGEVAEATKVNSNFLEIYQELENFPTVNGVLQSNAIGTANIKRFAVTIGKISTDAYLTSTADASDASDDTLITSKAVKDYVLGVL
jgi:hypothetical protein